MKNVQIQISLIFILSILLNSCTLSSSYDDEGSTVATSIFLSSDFSSIALGEAFHFTVTDNLGNNVSEQADYFYNGVEVSGPTFTPSQGGTFEVYATYGGLTSNELSVSVTVAQNMSSLILTSDQQEIVYGELVTFTAVGDDGTDFTSEALFYVDEELISGNTFVFEDMGNHTVTSTYDTFDSNDVNIFVGHTQKVLIEDYTGTWCGWCPRVAHAIELVDQQTDNMISVAIHGPYASNDPFKYQADELEDFVGVASYPGSRLNRLTQWTYPEPDYINEPLALQGDITDKGLAISSTLSGSTLNLSVDVSFTSGLVGGSKLVVLVLENGLIYNQTNYTEYYGGASTLVDFEHNHTLRLAPTGLFGQDITSSDLDTSTGNYTKNFSVSLTGSIIDYSQISIVAFITDSTGNALNSQSAEVNEIKTFD